MSQFLEYFRIALFNIKANKVRSMLTMLGIIIGISSVIMIISSGNGIKNGINEEMSSLVGGYIEVYSDSQDEDGNYVEFTDEDIKAVTEQIDHVKGATMLLQIGNAFSESRKGSFQTRLKFGTPDLEHFGKEEIEKGRYFTQEEYDGGEAVCVISQAGALNLFGTTDVVGMTVEVNWAGMIKDYQIVGVREGSDSMLNGLVYGSSDVMLEIPCTVINTVYGFIFNYTYLVVFSDSPDYSAAISEEAVSLLEARHDVRNQNAIGIYEYDSILEEYNTILGGITAFVVLVAMISLLVGGIGVMNIMLVSVTERTREIGIRKSLGARTGSILFQFLLEASTISLLGGVVGIILGLSGAFLLCSVASSLGNMHIVADFNVVVILGAALFSTAVGVFFGIYPARKAAKLSPIEALRRE